MTTPLFEAKNLQKYFPVKGGILNRTQAQVKAVDDVSFAINPGETLSIVGESGCGKSTTGRAILRLDDPTDGEILFEGQNLMELSKSDLRQKRKEMQIIFQDPYASLNPRQKVKQILDEAMAIQGVVPKAKRPERIRELMEVVGLRPEQAERYPFQFSGGQRQRIGIARALSVDPKLIVCDEAVSALDVSTQAQVLNLLKKLQKDLDLTYLFISHDLGVVRHISDRVIVMYLGKIVEIADKKDLFDSPRHPYTRALLSAIPIPDPSKTRERIVLQGDVPSPMNPPSGCRFHTRCPFATDICKTEEPELRSTTFMNETHKAACHHIEKIAETEKTSIV
ncbi:ABC transporter ATP-binding protein [Geomicrobium sediminis]|uniref:Peptide/nickel transport system ATP-binding protein/oligopeptide transport system ATP-binding protein n=1 Tax=Geomicrobium sediminis TaxID=1347788 RepID=A0ABS2P827_9BACL|nr:dipeptide ABC transporter ATP-binding protein [Geomicrobium sediminis]MBM7631511.1 peptide/nickel transport system ATP-binding protein/oligopeptide transport system ATP-binding protein [Geomicrobium sediminis]